MGDIKAMIQNNLINNNKVIIDDVNLATKSYGPDVGETEGNTTINMPTQVVSNIVEIPGEFLEV